MTEKFSLKDHLFNKLKVEKLALEIKKVDPEFKTKDFIEQVVNKFPELELKQRISWMSEKLRDFLPKDYRKAISIILKALPAPLDETKTDDDFGDFIYAPYLDFVAKYGCTKKDVLFSLKAIRELTMRFSAEDAIRTFINTFPNETFEQLEKWVNDSHYHIRRLVSEGTRAKLPWSQKLNTPVEKPVYLLSKLFLDKTRYVTRSVANHMNDISKFNPELVLKTLDEWQKSEKQNPTEMEYIIKHSLRTLVKTGNKQAIEFLKFSADPQVSVSPIRLTNEQVKINTDLEFTTTITSQKKERLLIDYVIYFQSKSGTLTNSKVFKLKQCEIEKDNCLVVTKKHKLRGNMTTRTIYPGKHLIEIQINGKKMQKKEFTVVK